MLGFGSIALGEFISTVLNKEFCSDTRGKLILYGTYNKCLYVGRPSWATELVGICCVTL